MHTRAEGDRERKQRDTVADVVARITQETRQHTKLQTHLYLLAVNVAVIYTRIDRWMSDTCCVIAGTVLMSLGVPSKFKGCDQ